MISLLETLKDLKIVGIYCSACDFTIEVYGDHSNKDFLIAARIHNGRYHRDNETKYDIRTELKITKTVPVITHVKLELVTAPKTANPRKVEIE